jgi:hypothetical protein
MGRMKAVISIQNSISCAHAPKRQYQKRKVQGNADARGLTGAEIAQKDLKVREREATANQERTVGTPDEEERAFISYRHSSKVYRGILR